MEMCSTSLSLYIEQMRKTLKTLFHVKYDAIMATDISGGCRRRRSGWRTGMGVGMSGCVGEAR